MDYIDTLRANIRTLAKERGKALRTISQEAKLHPTYIAEMMTKENANPTLNAIKSIAEVLGVDANTLLEKHGASSDVHDFILIPLYDAKVSAGGGLVALNEETKDFLSVSPSLVRRMGGISSADNLCALEVLGDSMSPTFVNGEIVYVDRGQDNPSDMGVFILSYEESLFIKRISLNFSAQKYEVISDNKAYSSFFADESELHIVGKVIGAISWY